MSQRNVERLIGRLATDEDLRRKFSRAPFDTLATLCEEGWELTRGEIDALVEIDSQLWARLAAKLPSRLQRCSLRCDERSGN